MVKRDPRKKAISKVRWKDAFGKHNSTIGEALRDNTLIEQTTYGHVSKKNKTLIQVLTSVEDKGAVDDANCDYINIPASW